MARELGIFGSIDMNRNDYQSGWDTDQFPNNTPEVALAYYHVLNAGGFTQGGTNFDAKVRAQSIDDEDLVAALQRFEKAIASNDLTEVQAMLRATVEGYAPGSAAAATAPGTDEWQPQSQTLH